MCGTIRALTRERLLLWLRRFCGANVCCSGFFSHRPECLLLLLLQSTSVSSLLIPSGLTRRKLIGPCLVLRLLVSMAVVCNGLASLDCTYVIHRIWCEESEDVWALQ